MNNKMEYSKKIVLCAGIIFAIVVVVCLGIFVYCTLYNVMYDWTGIVALLTVTGSVFGTALATYANKAKLENGYKIRLSFLREKYNILNEIGALDCIRAQDEIENEITQIEYRLDAEEETALSEQNYQEMV